MEKRWKRHEREIAELLGGKRIPITGRKGPDIAHDWLSPECKSRKEIPNWLKEALQQAKQGKPENTLPIVVLHEVGTRHTQDLVVISLADFRDWFIGGKDVPDKKTT